MCWSAVYFSLYVLQLLFKCCKSFENNIFQHFPPSKVKNNTEFVLSDEELSIQFTLSYLTFLNKNKWSKEWLIESNPLQLDFSSVRYQLAFLSYSSVLFCSKTIGYREICINILSNSIERMLERYPVWHYIDFWWGPNQAQQTCQFEIGGCLFPEKANWTQSSSWPDPVKFQNIMYSGHFAHLLTLFEIISQNNTYSVNGFNFIYNDSISFHYNTSSLLNHLANIQLNPLNKQGAIPCEPFQSFTVCNQHQNIAMHIYNNVLYPDSFNSENLHNAMNKFHQYFQYETPWSNINNTGDGWIQGLYFQDKSMYLDNSKYTDQPWSKQHLKAGWILDHSGFADIGVWGFQQSASSDAWAATVSYLWLNHSDINSFICNDGLLKLYNRSSWIFDKKYNGSFIDDPFGGTCFSTALYSVAAKQCLWFNQMNENISKDTIENIKDKIIFSRDYLINKFGVTLNNKYNITAPFINSSGYNCDKTQGCSIINTALLGASMSIYNDSWRKIHSNPWPKVQTEFELISVNYPFVMVRYAMVDVYNNNLLQFELVVAVNQDQKNTLIQVRLNGNLDKVMQNQQELVMDQLNINENILTINTTISVSESSLFDVFTT